jgi:hypothetical protein
MQPLSKAALFLEGGCLGCDLAVQEVAGKVEE